MQCNNKNVEWTSISKSTLQGDVKQLRKYNCKWTQTNTQNKKKEKKKNAKSAPYTKKKIVLDENSYANAGMSSLLPSYCQKAMFFCVFFLFVRSSYFDESWFRFLWPLLQTRIREPFSTCRQGERIISFKAENKPLWGGWIIFFGVFVGGTWLRVKQNKD